MSTPTSADHIGTRIRYRRRRRGGMTQQTLAGLAGVSRPFISMVESGVRTIERRSTMIGRAGGGVRGDVAPTRRGQPGMFVDSALAGRTGGPHHVLTAISNG